MNKNTKLILGFGLVAAGGYFYWKSKKPADTPKVAYDATLVRAVGRRQNFSSNLPVKGSNFNFSNNLIVKDSGWLRIEGAGTFFKTHDSGWVG